jgi:hypothetical protein
MTYAKVAPWLHAVLVAAVLGVVLYAVLHQSPWIPSLVSLASSRVFGHGLNEVRRLDPVPVVLRPEESVDQLLDRAHGLVHDAVNGLTAIRGELDLLAGDIATRRRQVTRWRAP